MNTNNEINIFHVSHRSYVRRVVVFEFVNFTYSIHLPRADDVIVQSIGYSENVAFSKAHLALVGLIVVKMSSVERRYIFLMNTFAKYTMIVFLLFGNLLDMKRVADMIGQHLLVFVL